MCWVPTTSSEPFKIQRFFDVLSSEPGKQISLQLKPPEPLDNQVTYNILFPGAIFLPRLLLRTNYYEEQVVSDPAHGFNVGPGPALRGFRCSAHHSNLFGFDLRSCFFLNPMMKVRSHVQRGARGVGTRRRGVDGQGHLSRLRGCAD